MNNRREDVGGHSDDDVERFGTRTTLSESTVASEVRPVGLRRTVSERGERIRWGPIWTGAFVAVATYLLLELLLLAAGAIDRDSSDIAGLPDGAWWSLLAAIVAFFVGGLVAGASIVSRDSGDGFLHGIGVWAVATVAFLVFAVIGTGLALGTLGHAVARLDPDRESEQGVTDEDTQESAGAAALTLGATALAAGVGGIAGTKLWPRRDDDAVRLRDDASRQSVS